MSHKRKVPEPDWDTPQDRMKNPSAWYKKNFWKYHTYQDDKTNAHKKDMDEWRAQGSPEPGYQKDVFKDDPFYH